MYLIFPSLSFSISRDRLGCEVYGVCVLILNSVRRLFRALSMRLDSSVMIFDTEYLVDVYAFLLAVRRLYFCTVD